MFQVIVISKQGTVQLHESCEFWRVNEIVHENKHTGNQVLIVPVSQ